MEKQKWVRPQAIVQEFVANEYVAACGDSGTVYKFECNAGSSYKEYAVKDSNGKIATISGRYMDGVFSSYSPCGETHEAESNSGFLKGYYLDDPDTWWKDEKIPVIIWTNNNTDVHCTTNLNMESWQTAKS